MSLLGWIIFFCLIGGVLSVFAAATFLLLSENLRKRLLPHMVSYAIGALLGAAFLNVLPHALNHSAVTDLHDVTLTVLIGILAFFLLEKMVLWRHCHAHDCEVHGEEDREHAHGAARGTMIMIGDGMHNLVDGVLIGAAFLTDFHVGVVTSIAVAAHEIPQELGDFSILLHSGYSRMKALMINIASSLTTVIGGVAAYYGLQEAQQLVPYILAVAAASFIYIAVADLIPSLHQRTEARVTAQQMTLIAAGVVTIFLAHSTLH
ncbi:MAG: ZIP family metal transporter [Sulfuriflexus sp.]|nr:ZIP family metal transporter [Sulfuriflexus sp.]